MDASKRRQLLLAAALMAGALLIALVLINLRPEPALSEPIRKPLQVEVLEIHRQTQPIVLHAQGSVQPRTQTQLIAEVRGRVIEVAPAFHAGGFFHKGDTLLRMDDRHYAAEVKRAEATVAAARSTLLQEKGRAEVAYQDWIKAGRPAYRTEDARALSLRKPQVTQAEADLAFAEAELERVRGDLEHTVIRAPYDGLVQDKQVDVGQYINVGTALGTLMAADVAEIRLPMPENRLDYLRLPEHYRHPASGPQPPLPVQLSLTINQRTDRWTGELVRTEGALDERSRVLHLVAQVRDPYGLQADADPATPLLRFGQFVEAAIEGRPIPDLVRLPRHVLRAGNRLWVVDHDNRLQDRRVEVLLSEGHVSYIAGGLEDGERICLTPVGNVLPGTVVEVITPAADESDGI